MARTLWTLYYMDSSGSWIAIADGLPRPNDMLAIPQLSNRTGVKLANGAKAYITPETTFIYDKLNLIWMWDDGTIKDQIEGYIVNNDKYKIVDHNNTEYVGYFLSCNSSWQVGVDGDYYNLEASFDIVSVTKSA